LPHTLQILQSAQRDLKALSREIRQRLRDSIDELANDPRPQGVKVLQGGGERRFRVRVGDYRVIYRIDDKEGVVSVTRVGHRRDVYRSGG